MTLDLSNDAQRYVQQKLATGEYASESEVVSKAIALMREYDLKLSALHADIQKGLAGPSEPLDVEKIKQEARFLSVS